MKLTILLVVLCTFQATAGLTAQTITFKTNDAEIGTVLSSIQRQGDFRFLYNSKLKDLKQKVTVDFKELEIKDVLKQLFAGTNLTFLQLDNNLVAIRSNSPEEKDIKVTGRVTNDAGEGLGAVSVTVKGTTRGTVTDMNGNFAITAPENAVLIVSAIGYNTLEVNVNNQQVVNVKLTQATQKMDEVVVVGYGVQKRSVLTGAISSVKAKDIENVPNGRIEQALQGRVSGVTIASNSGQPGSSSTVRVRGITTFNDNNPLWVIDGMIVDNGGIGFLNQADIESIEVLKDAASLAIYGARSAAGVILVTTKKGKKGKINATYNGFYGVSSPERRLKLLNATQYGALMNEKSVAAGGNVIFPDLSTLGVGTDWQDAIFNNNARRYSHEVSFSTGNDVSTFYASFGIQDYQGIVATDISNYNKKSIRLNSTHKAAKFLSFGQTFGYTRQTTVGIGSLNSEFGGVLSSAINLDPITPLVVTDPAVANTSLYTNNAVMRDENGNPYGISSLVGQEITNPLAYIKTRLGRYDWSDDMVGNAYVEIAPIPGLKFRSTIGAKLAFWGNEGFTPKYYLNASTLTSQNNIGRETNKGFGWNVENTVSYNKRFGDHNLGVLLGQGAYVDGIVSSSGVTYFDIPVTDYRDASFNFGATAAKKDSWASNGVIHKVSSLFTRVNYDYKEKYLFTGIMRRDGSSRFGTNNKYGYFPSFSVGWVASNEDFWVVNNVVNQLKVRGGYGVTGNDAIGNFRYLSTIGGGRNYTYGNGGVIQPGFSPNAPENPDLRWEETRQLNIGLEARLLKDFNLTVDFFKKTTKGILQDVDIPGYVGATGRPAGNVADMDNTGVEVELGYRKRFGEFNFSANGNVTFLRNNVSYVGLGKTEIAGYASFQSMGPVTIIKAGMPFNTFYGYQTDGIFQNWSEVNAYKNSTGALMQPKAKPGDFRWKDADGNGVIDAQDKVNLGNSLPKVTFGFTVNAEYKGFDLMLFTQGATGNKIFQGLRRLDIGNSNYSTKALSRWTGEGTSNTYPRLTNLDENGNFGNMSDFYLEKGDYLRFKLVQLGYSITNKAVQRIGISKLRIYVTGENLFTITRYSGYDPEIGGSVFGIDKGYYPQARTFLCGINLQF
nr:TonB-dependent receptor [uncultured Lacibacter sp.]